MLRSTAMLGCVVMVLALPAQAGPGCPGCKKVAASGDGFCCGKGMAFGVALTSEKLHEALQGVAVSPAKMKCAGCKTAAKTNGRCDHCNVAVAHGKAFKSPVAHALAKGTPVAADKAVHCDGCKKAYADHGYCTGCSVGFVAGRLFKDQESHAVALAAHNTLAKAAEAKCEACAVAMVTDGKCAHCKVGFKDGKKTTN